MDGTEANRRNCTRGDAAADPGQDKKSGSRERVTLKKEIGLMSACAIIIGTSFSSSLFHCVCVSEV